MNTIDRIFGSIVIGFIVPITTLCAFWWGSYLLGFNPVRGLILGLILGIFADMIAVRKLVTNFYDYNTAILVAMFLMYSIGIFGFFMGVPVFNILVGIMAAFYIGRRLKISGADISGFTTALHKTNIFSTLILIVICFCSAYIALKDPYTASNLKGMLGLHFEVSMSMLWSLIIAGGLSLLAIQYTLSIILGRLAYGMVRKS